MDLRQVDLTKIGEEAVCFHVCLVETAESW